MTWASIPAGGGLRMDLRALSNNPLPCSGRVFETLLVDHRIKGVGPQVSHYPADMPTV
jgi:hypothetical protein